MGRHSPTEPAAGRSDPRPKAWYGSLLPAPEQPPDEGNSQGQGNASRKRHVPYPLALLDADQRLVLRVENPDGHRGIAIRVTGRHNTLTTTLSVLRLSSDRAYTANPARSSWVSIGDGFARQLFGDRETATEVWSRDEVLNRTRRVALLLA